MKPAFAAAAIVVVAGGLLLLARSGRNGDEADGSPEGKGKVELVGVVHEGYTLPIPVSWLRGDRTARSLPAKGILFAGPFENGFRPNILFWPPPTGGQRPLEVYARDEISKLRNPANPIEILGQTEALVGGTMPAKRVTYTSNEKVPGDGRKIQVRSIDWYFVGPSGNGMLRINCNSTTFMTWRPVFERIAAGLRPLK